MLNKYLSLSKQIFYALAFVSMLSLIIFSGLTVYHISRDSQSQSKALLRKDLKSISRELSLSLKNQSILRDSSDLYSYPLVLDKINTTATAFDIGLDFYTISGSHLYKASNDYSALYYNTLSTQPNAGIGIAKSVLERIDSLGGIYIEPQNKVDSILVSSIYSILYNSKGEKIGLTRILYPQTNYINQQSLTSLKSQLNYTLIAFIIVSSLVAWMVARSITKPIAQLEKTLRRTSTIDHTSPIEWSGSTDLYLLVDAYNQMLLKLRQSSDSKVESQKEQAWKEMSKIVAHEIKNPLTPMRLSVESYLMSFNPNAPDAHQRAENMCQILIEQIDTLSHIASSFSDFSSGKTPQKGENCDLVKIIPLGLGIFKNKSISYYCTCEQALVALDKTAVIQILSNLIKNALDSQRIRQHIIEVSLSIDDICAHIAIKDNGTGIPTSTLENIFKPSFTTKSSGMGMGLAIVKGVVESAGGQISCHSTPSEGSIFDIRLPLV